MPAFDFTSRIVKLRKRFFTFPVIQQKTQEMQKMLHMCIMKLTLYLYFGGQQFKQKFLAE